MLALACILRIFGLLSLSTISYFNVPRLDEAVYHTWASQLANGTYKPTSVYQAAPLPAYVMALVYKVFSPKLLYIRILNICLGVTTCYVVYRIGWELANRRIGLVAGFVAAGYKPFIFYSVVPMKTALSVLLFACTMAWFLAALRNPSRTRALCLGVAAGLLISTRENAVVFVPLIGGLIFWTTYREYSSVAKTSTLFLTFVVGLTIATAPFAIRNYMVSGELLMTTHQAGFNLYLGNNLDNPDPYYRPVPFATSYPPHQGIQFTIEASRREGRTLSSAEASSYWTHEVVTMALAHPREFTWKLWQKVLVLFNRFEAGDHYSIDFMSQFAPFFRLPLPDLTLIFPLGLAGMATTGFASRQAFGASIAAIAYGMTLIIFFTNDRYRLPLLTLLIPFAVIGLDHLRTHVRQARIKNIAIYTGLVTLFVIVEYLPVQGTDDVAAYYNIHGQLLERKGSKEEAIASWETSSRINKPFSAFANLHLARKYLGKKDFKQARSYLEMIPDSSFAAAGKYEAIGDLLLAQDHVAEAVTAYERSLAINSGERAPRFKLINIFERIDRDRGRQEQEAWRYISSFYKHQ
jgi:4-amino-4-deoxy-L-arabinose transferase-like glycosyltransferase